MTATEFHLIAIVIFINDLMTQKKRKFDWIKNRISSYKCYAPFKLPFENISFRRNKFHFENRTRNELALTLHSHHIQFWNCLKKYVNLFVLLVFFLFPLLFFWQNVNYSLACSIKNSMSKRYVNYLPALATLKNVRSYVTRMVKVKAVLLLHLQQNKMRWPP